jgi:hypothetical protein
MTMHTTRTPSLPALLFLVLTAPGCSHCGDVRPTGDDYANIALAKEHAMYKLIGKYGECFPPDYGVNSYFSDLQALALAPADLETLRKPELDVWTEPNCAGFILVARNGANGPVILWDKSSTDDKLDGPSGDSNLPERAPPTTCACRQANNAR